MSNTGTAAGYWDVPISNALIPKEGPRTVPVSYPFTSADTQFTTDFTLAQYQKRITAIQSLFIDNWNNPKPVSITVSVVNETINFPAFSQGFIPINCPYPSNFTVSSAGQQLVKIYYINVPVPAATWTNEAALFPILNGALVVSEAAPQPVTPSRAAQHAVQVGSVSQLVFGPNQIVTGGFIFNPNNVGENLYVDIVGAAFVDPDGGPFGTSVEVLPGQTFYLKPSTVGVSVTAPTSGHPFVAVRY